MYLHFFHLLNSCLLFITFSVSSFKLLAFIYCFLYQLPTLQFSDFNLLQTKKSDYQPN